MFKKLTITACEDVTVRELIRLHEAGYPVYRSSHAGNWSTYKLLFSQIGIPDCIWDATCIYRDVNNRPRYQIVDGAAVALTNIPENSSGKEKSLTAYNYVKDSKETLARFHVKPLESMFGKVITSQSASLLEYEKNMETVFGIIEKYHPDQLGRYVLPCGCMVDMKKNGDQYTATCSHESRVVSKKELAESAMGTLRELNDLFWNPLADIPRGGVLYSFELVVATFYLWAFWKFGNKTIYLLSGPDMIGYATKNDFISKIDKVLRLVSSHAPEGLVPESIEVKIVPATLFRFGYVSDFEESKRIMGAHETVLSLQALKRQWKDVDEITGPINEALGSVIGLIKKESSSWNLFHNPAVDPFFSQHDLLARGAKMVVLEKYLDIPFSKMGEILRTLPQMENNLIRQFAG